jgi:hypothetical protein
MKKGRAGTMTHDYKRHGTTSLFAALDVATGAVIGQCMKPPPSGVPALLADHRPADAEDTISTSSSTTTPPTSIATLRHGWPSTRAFTCTSPPTSASWLNQVERFFGLITQDRIRRGVFTAVPELEAAIHEYLDHHNADPKPFVWTKSAEEILAKVTRARDALEQLASGNQALNPLH